MWSLLVCVEFTGWPYDECACVLKFATVFNFNSSTASDHLRRIVSKRRPRSLTYVRTHIWANSQTWLWILKHSDCANESVLSLCSPNEDFGRGYKRCAFSIDFSFTRGPNQVLTPAEKYSKTRIFCNLFQSLRLSGIKLPKCKYSRMQNFVVK